MCVCVGWAECEHSPEVSNVNYALYGHLNALMFSQKGKSRTRNPSHPLLRVTTHIVDTINPRVIEYDKTKSSNH